MMIKEIPYTYLPKLLSNFNIKIYILLSEKQVEGLLMQISTILRASGTVGAVEKIVKPHHLFPTAPDFPMALKHHFILAL